MRPEGRGFRRNIHPTGVRRADHDRQTVEWRRRQPEFFDHDVERAQFAAMAPEHILDVERRGAVMFTDGFDFGGRDEQEDSIGIDEASDQPRAGDAIDLGTRAGNPDRPSLRIRRR